jgi:hypothetical protein
VAQGSRPNPAWASAKLRRMEGTVAALRPISFTAPRSTKP